MKTSQIAACGFLVLTLAAGCSSSAGTGQSTSATGASSQSTSAPPENRERPVNAVVDIGPMLTGTFQGSTPGNNLTAITTGTLSPTNGSIFNLTMRVTGTYMDSGVREQGVIHLDTEIADGCLDFGVPSSSWTARRFPVLR